MISDIASSVPLLPPARVLAWSEARADLTGSAPPEIALWRPAGITAALGLSQDTEKEVHADTLRRDGAGLVRRQSGGGAVLLYEGVLCWEALASPEAIAAMGGSSGIRESYRRLCGPVFTALRGFGLPVFQAGVCDISLEPESGSGQPARKLAGTAQLRRKDRVLVHGSLLVSADTSLLERYLKMPGDQPEYRSGRPHGDFCTTVSDALAARGKERADVSAAAAAVLAAAAQLGWTLLTPCATEQPAAEKYFRNKYGGEEWNWHKKRRPEETGHEKA